MRAASRLWAAQVRLSTDPKEWVNRLERGESAGDLRTSADAHIQKFLTRCFDVTEEVTPENLEQLPALGYFN